MFSPTCARPAQGDDSIRVGIAAQDHEMIRRLQKLEFTAVIHGDRDAGQKAGRVLVNVSLWMLLSPRNRPTRASELCHRAGPQPDPVPRSRRRSRDVVRDLRTSLVLCGSRLLPDPAGRRGYGVDRMFSLLPSRNCGAPPEYRRDKQIP